MSATGNFKVTSDHRIVDDTVVDAASITVNKVLASGTSANQFDNGFKHVNAALSGTDTIDLKAYQSERETIVNLVDVVSLVIENTGTVAITISPGASNGWDAMIPAAMTVYPGGVVAIMGPTDPAYATDATHKTLDIAPVSGTGSYELEVKGRTA